MSKIKIKLMSWWSDSESLHRRMTRQFVSDEDLNFYEFVHENPDYTIVFGRTEWDKIETPKDKTFYISQEPLWSPNQSKNDIHNYCSKIFISDKRDYPDREEYIETLMPMFYAGRDENHAGEEWDWSKRMFDRDYEKSKCTSMIVTSNYNSHYQSLCNPETTRIIYQDRTDLSHKIIKNNPLIDVWGTFQENNGINSHGEVWSKLVALKEFKFSICAENTIQKNYISEKFWDCVLTDTVPIYIGCNNIGDYIDESYFVNLTDKIDDQTFIDNKLQIIVDNCDVMYKKYIPKIKELKEKFKTDYRFNLWEFIKKQISENSNKSEKLKFSIVTLFWTDGHENSTRLKNVKHCFPKMKHMCEYLKKNGILCEIKAYDFSPEKLLDESIHIPYELGEFKKSEKINKVVNDNLEFDYLFFMDSDEFFLEEDYHKILEIVKNIEKRKIITFDAAKLDYSTVEKIDRNEKIDFLNEDYAFAYSGPKQNGPLFAGMSGGLGGVYICDIDLITENGGYDESYVGWGGEDGEMLSRIMYSGKPYEIIPQRNFFPFHLPHFSDWGNEKYHKRFND